MVRLLSLLILIASPAHASIITVTYHKTQFQLDAKSIVSFRPVTTTEAKRIGYGVKTKINYLFVALASETTDEILAKINATDARGSFGTLTQPEGQPIVFRCPDNAAGPLPIMNKRAHPKANAQLLIGKRQYRVRETAAQIARVLEDCGGNVVPALPNSLQVEGWDD